MVVGDREAELTRFVQARGDALLRTAVFLCAGDQGEAEDLVQTTLVRAFVTWHQVRDEQAREAYVRRIMIRLSYRRSKAARPEQPGQLATEVHDAVEDRLDLVALLAALPPRQRAVLVLRYYEDLSEREIAETLGCSPGSVKRHASRGLSALRTRVGESTQSPTAGGTSGH